MSLKTIISVAVAPALLSLARIDGDASAHCTAAKDCI